eukprot:1137374-Pelagomonas_calceolata.AAC.4
MKVLHRGSAPMAAGSSGGRYKKYTMASGRGDDWMCSIGAQHQELHRRSAPRAPGLQIGRGQA